jgi:predicted esterase
LIEKLGENLKNKGVFIDVGIKDEFNIQYGARIIHNKMKKMGIEHYYEEYEDGHMNTSYRLDISISFVEKYLSMIS